MSNPANLIVVVSSHGGYKNAQKNHGPLWQSHGAPVLTFFPETSTTEGQDASYAATPSVSHGSAGLNEPLSTERLLWLISYLLDNTKADQFLLYSATTIGLEPEIPAKYFENSGALWGAFPSASADLISTNPNPSFPLIFSRAVATEVIQCVEKIFGTKDEKTKETTVKIPAEFRVWSAMISRLSAKGGIKVGSFGPQAFFRDRINGSDEAACMKAIQDGAIFLDGVRSDVLDNRLVRQFQHVYQGVKRGERYVPQPHSVRIIKNANPNPVLQGTPAPQQAAPSFRQYGR